MKNFIVRAITGIIFVAAIVVCFINPLAMTFLFAIVTGLTIWEFTGLVNGREGVDTNRFICTAAGVYFFVAMIGFCSEITPSTVFIPYLITVVYLMISELYAKNQDPVSTWAYTMMSQMYVALPFSLLGVLAFRGTHDGAIYSWLAPLSVFVFLWIVGPGNTLVHWIKAGVEILLYTQGEDDERQTKSPVRELQPILQAQIEAPEPLLTQRNTEQSLDRVVRTRLCAVSYKALRAPPVKA